MVKTVVDRIREKNPIPNPWRKGEVVRIIVKNNPDLKGRGGQWAIIEEVHNFSVTVKMWDGTFPIPIKIEHLTEWVLLPAERLQMMKLCERINKVATRDLEQPVKHFLAGLGKLQFPRLSSLEEKILTVIENRS